MPTVIVKGMSCGHCVASVTDALKKIDGVDNVRVDQLSGEASWDQTAPVDIDVVKAAIVGIGFEVAD